MTMSAIASSPRFRAFISYSHRDQLWAQWLHKSLESYRVPRKLVGQTTAAGVIPDRLAPIFRDRDELPSATDLSRKVDEALSESANLIIVCSPRSATSRWVNEEVLVFKRLGRADRIFCLIVDGEPNATDLPGRAAEECFAPALRFGIGSDGQPNSHPIEPIAADARAGKDGKPNAKLKLIAGMLDVGFDTLKRRELQRRNRRMVAITALALIIMAITTTLGITAIIARHDAERRQKQAEDLVGFMLGDLNDKLREVHRLDIMQAVDDKAMAYFGSLPTKDVTAAALLQRVTALEKIGSVRMDQGKIKAALDSYSSASELADELRQRFPDDLAFLAAYADSLKWVGQANWYLGDLGPALENFTAASDALQRCVDAKPTDAGFAAKLAFARNNLGRVLETRGQFDAAAAQYEMGKKIYQSLLAREPESIQWQSALGDAEDSLGKVALERGQIEQAIESYRADQRSKAELARRNPDNHDIQEYLLVSNAILGRTLVMSGHLEAATRYVRSAVVGARSLLVFDAKQAYWIEDLAYYGQLLGSVLRKGGQFDEAGTLDSMAVQELGKLVGQDGANVAWQRELVQAQLEYARLLIAQGRAGDVGDLAITARKTVDGLRAKSADDRNLILLAGQIEIVAGELAAGRGDHEAARQAWSLALDLLAPAAQGGSDPSFLAVWATSLLLLDQIEEASAIASRLGAMGYRDPDFVSLAARKQVEYPVNAEFAERIARLAE
jgi:tetratricopeptide (TPR) repeat protein